MAFVFCFCLQTQNLNLVKIRNMITTLDIEVLLISPKVIFMGEKDYQQYFLVKKFIEKKFKSRVYISKTIRNSNNVALSSRNSQLNQTNLKIAGLITNRLFDLKHSINMNKNKSNNLIIRIKKELIKKFDIKIDYLECRNLNNLGTNLYNKRYKLFVAYYLNSIRLIDNF